MNLIYYSLSRSGNPRYDQQWIQSIRSLRHYNRELPVCLMVYNGVSEIIIEEAARQDVMITLVGDYRESLCRSSRHGSVLSLYPTLHKFLSLCELETAECSQILYLDCDTFFFDDPDILFANYQECDWYAREAPSSQRCPHGYDPNNINELLLQSMAQEESLLPILPFNAGVCVLNHGVWREFEKLRAIFLDNVWRLLVGRHQRSGDGTDDHIRAAVLATATDADRSRALTYPSTNFWIAEEIALWLTLGAIEGVSQGFLSSDHVEQGHEFYDPKPPARHHVLTHYFSSLQDKFFSSPERNES